MNQESFPGGAICCRSALTAGVSVRSARSGSRTPAHPAKPTAAAGRPCSQTSANNPTPEHPAFDAGAAEGSAAKSLRNRWASEAAPVVTTHVCKPTRQRTTTGAACGSSGLGDVRSHGGSFPNREADDAGGEDAGATGSPGLPELCGIPDRVAVLVESVASAAPACASPDRWLVEQPASPATITSTVTPAEARVNNDPRLVVVLTMSSPDR